MNVVRKALLGSTVLLGVSALAGTAAADVFVLANITKDKDKTIEETITKDKDVFLDVLVERFLSEAAESEALVNQRNERNSVDQFGANPLNVDMSGSVTGNAGETQVNQDVGNMVNQANVLAIAAAIASGNPKFVDAQASVEQVNGDQGENSTDNSNTVNADSVDINGSINASINDNVGVTQVNQNGGNMNNQGNAISAAVGASPVVVALSEADLGQWTAGNEVTDGADGTVFRSATMTGSVNGNEGITQVNQAVGNMTNQSNVVSLAATGF